MLTYLESMTTHFFVASAVGITAVSAREARGMQVIRTFVPRYPRTLESIAFAISGLEADSNSGIRKVNAASQFGALRQTDASIEYPHRRRT